MARASNTKVNSAFEDAFRAMRGGFIFVAVLTSVLCLCQLIVPLFMIQVYDRVLGSRNLDTLTMLIVVAASFLNFVMSATGLTDALTKSITGLGLSPGWMLLIVVIFYLVLGCFMETLSMMITTIPIVAPIMAPQKIVNSAA